MKKAPSIIALLVATFALASCQKVVVDTEAPVIAGAKDFTLEIGSEKPNWTEGVTVTDNVDTTVAIVVDDSRVDLNTEGKYALVLTAKDAAGNESYEIKTVQVIDTNREIASFIESVDYTTIVNKISQLDAVVEIPQVATPLPEGSMGLILDDVRLELVVVADMTSPEAVNASLDLKVNIDSISIAVNPPADYVDPETGEHPGVTIASPDWFVKNVLNLRLTLVDGVAYSFFESRLHDPIRDEDGNVIGVEEDPVQISAILGFAMMMIPADVMPIFQLVLPVITDHKEKQLDALNLDTYTQVRTILSVVTALVGRLPNRDDIANSEYDIALADEVLTVSTPADQILSGIFLRVVLDGKGKTLNTLTLSAQLGLIKVSAVLTTINVKAPVAPEDAEDYEVVEELRVTTAIKGIIALNQQ